MNTKISKLEILAPNDDPGPSCARTVSIIDALIFVNRLYVIGKGAFIVLLLNVIQRGRSHCLICKICVTFFPHSSS